MGARVPQAQLTHSMGTGEETISKAKQSRSEKKARKVSPEAGGRGGSPGAGSGSHPTLSAAFGGMVPWPPGAGRGQEQAAW